MKNRKKVTKRGEVPISVYQQAAKLLSHGMPKLEATPCFEKEDLSGTSLRRYIKKSEERSNNVTMGYNQKVPQVFSNVTESDLANYVVDVSARFHGLNSKKFKNVAYEFAVANNINLPEA